MAKYFNATNARDRESLMSEIKQLRDAIAAHCRQHSGRYSARDRKLYAAIGLSLYGKGQKSVEKDADTALAAAIAGTEDAAR